MTRTARWTLLAMILIIMVNVIFIDLYHDEAYYWTWSRNLQLSYYDHPPMIAYGIRLMTTLFGHHHLSVRLFGILCWSGTALLVYALANDLFKREKIAEVSMIVFLLMPITQLEWHMSIPDAPQGFFWMLCLYSLNKIVLKDGLRWAWGLGVAAGGLMLSKYTGLILAPITLYLLIRFKPGAMKRPWPYLTLLGALLIASPVIIWNAQHEWKSIIFQLNHGLMMHAQHDGPRLRSLYILLYGMIIIPGPLIFVALCETLYRLRGRVQTTPEFALLFWPMVIDLGLHLLCALNAYQFPRWIQPATLSMAIFVGYGIVKWSWEKTYCGIIVFGCIWLIINHILADFPNNASQQAWQWYSRMTPFVQEVDAAKLVQRFKPELILSGEWWKASLLQYYLTDHPKTCTLPGGIYSEYHRECRTEFAKMKARTLKDALFVGSELNLQHLFKQFDHCKALIAHNYAIASKIDLWAGVQPVIGYYRSFYCWNGKLKHGIEKPRMLKGMWLGT